ncbi:MAG: molybdopterin-dependent oxidoreductase [Phycisphaerae bacterium]|nr:molybdopterin-dependent oxidoreductase [Phycisphaerae bacterium]
MNTLFVNYGDFTTNSLNHIGGFANTLCASGHACIVAVPHRKETLQHIADPLFIAAAYDELLARPNLFPDGRPAAVIHAWTPRECVRKFTVAYQRAALAFAGSAPTPRLFIHLEDNEHFLLECFTGRSLAALRAAGANELAALLNDSLPHPVRIETFLRLADGVTHIIDRLAAFAPPGTPTHLLFPGVDFNAYAPQAADPAVRAELGLAAAERVIVFTGSNTFANEPEMRDLYLAVALLNQRGVPTRLVRTGFNSPRFLAGLADDVKRHVLDLGFVPKSRLPRLLALADVLVQPGRPGSFNDFRLPSKLPEFLAIGKPVVLPPANLAALLQDGRDAVFLPATGAPADIADACQRLFADPALGTTLGENAAAFARRHFDLAANTRGLLDFYSAILARRTGRPVKRVATRSEDFVTRQHRPQFHNTVRLGLTSDGIITALHAKVISNVGAQRASAASGSWFGYENLYAAANIKLEATDVFTNSYLSGPYRCVSHPAATLGQEVALDEAANQLGMDPVEIRLKNFNLTGNPFNGAPFSNPGIATTLTETARAIDWANKWHAPGTKEVRPGVFHGIGIACHTCSHGGGLGGSGQVHINADGTMNVISGSNEVGSGQRSNVLMIAAEAMGIPLSMAKITPYVDTDLTTDTIGTFGSLQTNTAGSGVYEAAMDARRQIFARAIPLFLDNLDLEVTVEQLDIKDGKVYVIDNPEASMTVADVVRTAGLGGIVGNGKHVAIPGFTRAAYATQAAEIEVDTVTGSIEVISYVAAHDVGKALNPFNLDSQIHGGVIQGIGAALTEEMLTDVTHEGIRKPGKICR